MTSLHGANWPLHRTTAAVVGGALLLLSGLWSAVIVQSSHEENETMQAAIERNNSIAVAFEQYTIRTIQAADAVTRLLKATVEKHRSTAPLQELIDTNILEGGVYQGVGIADASGTIVSTTMSNQYAGINISDRPHFQAHVAGDIGAFIGRPVISKILGEPSIPISRRLENPDGSFAGVVVVQIAPRRFTEFYKSASLSGTSFISLRNLDGIALARRRGQIESAGENFGGSLGYNKTTTTSVGSVLAPGVDDNIRRLMSFRRLSQFPLVVSVGVSESEILAGASARGRFYFAAALAVTIAVLVFTSALISAFSRRDHALVKLLERENDLRRLAAHDALTSLPNRTAFETHAHGMLAEAQAAGAQIALCFIDLDNFKILNDTFGHTTGDDILRAAASQMRSALNRGEFLARLGGDEFVVTSTIMHERQQDASDLANNLLRALDKPMRVGTREITVSASIGLSVFPEHGSSLAELMRHSDDAMYEAKRNGKNRHALYVAELGRDAERRLAVEQKLRIAVTNSTLNVHYQPQVNLRTGAPVGFEALIRWNDDELGSVSPAEFIPVAEECGLILPIGEWVARQACLQAAEWRRAGFDLRISVNVSPLQFRQPEIVDVVQRALAESDLAPAALELELTETMIAGCPEQIAHRLAELKRIGVRLALDDFGTGYSNLAYLRKFPIDVLKVDRAFVRDLPGDNDAAAIARAIIALGRSLHLEVVAEGVEDSAQAAFLLREGCDICQGYAYAKPMPPEECLDWLRHNRTSNILPRLQPQML